MMPRQVAGHAVYGLFVAIVAIVASSACASARRRPPLAAPPSLNEQAATGQVVFMEKCNRCHPGGEAGLGPALTDKPFPDFLKRFQVRHGLGVMPAFDKSEMTDEQLSDVLAYIRALRRHDNRQAFAESREATRARRP